MSCRCTSTSTSTALQHLNVIPLTGKQQGGKPFDISIDRIAGAAPELCPIDMKARWQCFLHERGFFARSRYGKIGSVDPCLMVSGRRMMSKPFAAPSVCVHCMQGPIVPSNGGHSGLSCSRSRSKPKSPLQKAAEMKEENNETKVRVRMELANPIRMYVFQFQGTELDFKRC